MNNNSNSAVLLVVALAIVVGAFLYYQHDKNTATINIPGKGSIEITQ